MKNTLVVNLIGGQGSGKSTMMANLFAWLKWHNVDSEMCSEFAKELVWENRQETFKDEMYIFAKQNHRLFRCNGKVDVVITDRPLIMSIAYNRFYGDANNDKWNKAYENIVKETFNQYNNFNIFLNRVKPFNPNGRNESEETARSFDEFFKNLLDETGINYFTYDGCEASVETIGNEILKAINGHNGTYIPMKDLKPKNVFEKDGYINVAISDAQNGFVWITTPEYYNGANVVYDYITAALLDVEDVSVKLITKDIDKYKAQSIQR